VAAIVAPNGAACPLYIQAGASAQSFPDQDIVDIGTTIIAVIGTIAAFGTPVTLMYMWLHRPAARQPQLGGQRAVDSMLEARLERIEVAVQAIALETERIAEGQRFTTKLLTAAPERIGERTGKPGA
jgi:hypothetical protein